MGRGSCVQMIHAELHHRTKPAIVELLRQHTANEQTRPPTNMLPAALPVHLACSLCSHMQPEAALTLEVLAMKQSGMCS